MCALSAVYMRACLRAAVSASAQARVCVYSGEGGEGWVGGDTGVGRSQGHARVRPQSNISARIHVCACVCVLACGRLGGRVMGVCACRWVGVCVLACVHAHALACLSQSVRS